MKLHSYIAPVLLTGALLGGAFGLSRSERAHEAMVQEEAARLHNLPRPSMLDAIGQWVIDGLDAAARLILPAPPAPVYNGETVGYGPGSADSLPAFPNCEGPGCGALQQFRPNGIRVCRVKNLASNGTGSFQACMAIVEADSNTANKPLDIIVFDTAGFIHWSPTCSGSDCSIWRGVYIMGQSAPGPWVMRGNNINPVLGGTEDVVWRSVAHRGVASPTQSYSFRMKGFRDICDHCSISHGPQRSIQSFAIAPEFGPFTDSLDMTRYHTWSNVFFSYKTTRDDRTANNTDPPTMFMFTGSPRPVGLISHIAFLRSVIFGHDPQNTNATYRVPNSNADSFWIHNNLYYMQDAGNQWMVGNDGAVGDYTYNEFRAGSGISSNPANSNYWPFAQDSLNGCTWVSQDTTPSLCDPSFHYNKNHFSHIAVGFYVGDYGDTIKSQDSIWIGDPGGRVIGIFPGLGSTTDSTTPPIGRRRTTGLALTSLPFGFDTVTVNLANMNVILDSAGSGWKIDSLGQAYMVRDTVDRRARASVIDTANYTDPGDVNRDSFIVDFYPDFEADVSPKCRDEEGGGVGDGMCDKWEELVADTSLLPGSIRASGYSAIELAYAGGIVNLDTVFGDATPVVNRAFRTAVGHGAKSLEVCRDSVVNGSWPLKVIPVTSLTAGGGNGTSDSALRAVAANTFNIIIYQVGGVIADQIDLTTGVTDCLWIAGQSAPGGGIAYRQLAADPQMKIDGAHDLRVSYLRFWADTHGVGVGGIDNLNLVDCVNCIFDNLSLHGAVSQIIGIEPAVPDSVVDVTLQNALWAHTYSRGMLIDQDPGDGPLDRLTLYQLYSADAKARRPDVTAEDTVGYIGLEKIENVDHNSWGTWFGRHNGNFEIDYLDNFVSQRTGGSYAEIWNLYECQDFAESPPCTDLDNRYPDVLYADGNRIRDGSKLDYFMWTLKAGGGAIPDSVKRAGRITSTGWPAFYDAYDAAVTMDSNRAEVVIAKAGANARLTCGGTLIANRDALDDTTAIHFTNAVGTAVDLTQISDFWITADFPSLTAGTACPDLDDDGLPDLFEKWVQNSTTDSTTVPADSLIAGDFAIAHYLNGDSVYLAQVLGFAVDATFGDGRYAYYADTMWYRKITAGGADTDFSLIPDSNRVPLGHIGLPFMKDDSSRMLWLTYDSIQAIDFEDSAAATDSATDWNYDPADTVRTIPVPGGP